MDVNKIKSFLWKCVVINFIILILMLPILLFSDEVYEIHSQWFQWFQGSKVEFATYIYYILGFYKLIWIFFNVVPYLALRMLDKKDDENM
jgi:hypothetical protein